MGDDFWAALDGLDRLALYRDTVAALRAAPDGLSLGGLATVLPPRHALETLAYWIGLGRETEADFNNARETLEVTAEDGILTRFDLPLVTLESAVVENVNPENLG